MNKRVHVFYSGLVQGVGFRFSSESLARGLDVTGWVKNLADKRVEIIAEASEEKLQEFLGRLSGQFARYIRDCNVEWQPATGEFSEFKVEF